MLALMLNPELPLMPSPPDCSTHAASVACSISYSPEENSDQYGGGGAEGGVQESQPSQLHDNAPKPSHVYAYPVIQKSQVLP